MDFFRVIFLSYLLGFAPIFSVEFDHSFNHSNRELITHFSIFGERCSGTNFLEYLVKQNIIGIESTSEYGHKHFPHWVDLSEYSYSLTDDKSFLEHSNHCLGILIVRNVYDWVRSFYRNHPHADVSVLDLEFFEFMSEPWTSNDYEPAHTIDKLNPYQNRPFKNVLELRKFKLMNHLAIGKVMGNFVVVRYEDLREAPEEFIEYIAYKYGLEQKTKFEPVIRYKGFKNKPFIKKKYRNFTKEEFEFLNSHVDWAMENRVGYTQKERKEVNSAFPW